LQRFHDFVDSGGKPITPTGDQALLNGNHMNGVHEGNGLVVVDGATKLEVCMIANRPSNRQIRLTVLLILGVATSQSIKRYKVTTKRCR
jgi:hypothetical protein